MAIETRNLSLTPVYPGQPRIVSTAPSMLQGDFARLLDAAGNEPPSLPAASESAAARGVATKGLGPVNLAGFSEQRLADFADRFRAKLAAAGIDTSIPVELDIARDGSIMASGHPDAARIRDLLAKDPALANEYRALAAQSEVAAQAKLAAAYTRDWFAATTDRDRKAVWSRYSGLAEQLSREAGARITIGPRGAESAALQFVQARGFA